MKSWFYLLGLSLPLWAQIPASYKSIHFPSSVWQAPDPLQYRTQLSSGVVAYLLPDTSLPMIKLHVLFRGPGYGQDSSRLAARSLLSSMLIQGGTDKINAAQMADSLEFTASKMSVQLGAQSSTLTLECLTQDFPSMLNLLKQSLQKPGFDSSLLGVQKLDLIESVKHRYDRPSPVSSELYKQVLYGNHPSNWDPRPQEIEKVSAQDLQQEMNSILGSEQMWIGVTGDFKTESMKKLLSDWSAHWPKAQPLKDKAPDVLPQQAPGLFVLNYASTQTQVRVGAPFVKRPHPDYYAASLAAYILAGGGFGSRLVDRIRTDEGLAYHVGASAGNSYFQVPTVDIQLQTKAPSTARALEITWEELRKLIQQGPDSTELAAAKTALIQSLPANFDNAENTVDAFLTNELYGRPLDHYRKFPQEIAQLTAAQVQAAAARYFAPEKLSITLVGPWAEITQGDRRGFLKQFPLKEWKLQDLDLRSSNF